MKNIIFTLCLLFSTVLLSRADLIVEPSKKLPFSLLNLDSFSDYEFYFLYKTYNKNSSSKDARIDTLKVEKNKIYSGGERGEGTFLIAKKDGKVVAISEIEIKGMHQSNKKKIKKASQTIEIKSVSEGKIIFEVKEYQYEFENGKVKKVKAGFETPIWILGISLLALALISWLFYQQKESALI